MTPSLTLTSVFDDNVFETSSGREADLITRLTPGVIFGYRSAPLTIVGDFSFDAEKYAVNDDLDNVGDRLRGIFEARYLPDRRLTLGLAAVYARTNRPVELSRQQGLQPIVRQDRGLEETTALTAGPSVAYRLSPLATVTGGYSFSLIEPDTGVSTTTHAVNLGLTRLFTPKDTGLLTYSFQLFDDSTGNAELSHTLLIGWTRLLG